jgi:hypothetical protein
VEGQLADRACREALVHGAAPPVIATRRVLPAVPGSPADAYDLLRAAVLDDIPVLYFEHKAMLNLKGELDDERGSLLSPGRSSTWAVSRRVMPSGAT